MALKMSERKAVTKEVGKRYRKAGRREKEMMLSEFVATTGYNRSYASRVLREEALKRSKPAKKRPRKKIYDEAVLEPP